MARLDLNDLPPKVAALLTELSDGEELLLVEHGLVVARFVAAAPPAPEADHPAAPPEQQMREVFENFRASIEDEF